MPLIVIIFNYICDGLIAFSKEHSFSTLIMLQLYIAAVLWVIFQHIRCSYKYSYMRHILFDSVAILIAGIITGGVVRMLQFNESNSWQQAMAITYVAFIGLSALVNLNDFLNLRVSGFWRRLTLIVLLEIFIAPIKTIS